MREPIRVLVLGTGAMGIGIARLVRAKQGLALVGAFARRPERAGVDIGTVLDDGQGMGPRIGCDLSALIEHARPQVAVQATCSRLGDALDEISMLVRAGVHVISIAEEMAFPACTDAQVAARLDGEAIAHGVTILGTGINPGFVMDLLVVTLTGVCSDIRSIRAERVNDLYAYGSSVLRTQGVGLTPLEFQQGVRAGSVVGHIGFGESIHMIASAIGWHVERVEQSLTPVIASVRRESPCVTVLPGQVAGCIQTAIAYRNGEPAITLVHPQQLQPNREGIETGDTIEIIGTPNVRFSGSPEIAGGAGTCALAVNMIPRVLAAAPGLRSMTDLPVPAAMLGDAREVLERG